MLQKLSYAVIVCVSCGTSGLPSHPLEHMCSERVTAMQKHHIVRLESCDSTIYPMY